MAYRVTHETGPAHMTHLQGHVETSFTRLRQLFGEPGPGDGYKVQAEWTLLIDDNGREVVATVYDWKQGDNYNGPGQGIPLREVTDWHIGGHEARAAELVQSIIKRAERATNAITATRDAKRAKLEAERRQITARLAEIETELAAA